MKKLWNWLFGPNLTRYSAGDTFETHECILCKRDPDASYCMKRPE